MCKKCNTMETVTVNAKALKQLLEAVNGPGHLIKELQVLAKFSDSPITVLIDEFNDAVVAFNKSQEVL